MRKKLVILTNDYPSKDKIYANAFVHSRAINYLEIYEINVFICSLNQEQNDYEYEGIKVSYKKNQNEIAEAVKKVNPTVIAIHFVEGWMLNKIIKPSKCPVYIWVHGTEALGWYRRLFNRYTLKQLIGYIYRNTIQLFQLRKIISYSNKTRKVHFIFVSNWMKQITETDTFSKIKLFSIIPNPIDTDQFIKKGNKSDQRTNILLIRPFASKKYANDIAVKSILELSKSNLFDKFKISIYGDGALFDSETNSIKKFKNVHLKRGFVPHSEINKLHDENGIFLCPTRQDAQGVSMCEAMASGLVVISSNNTAIPEFIENGVTGILTDSTKDIAKAIIKLYNNPEKMEQISKSASIGIEKIAGYKDVIRRELQLLGTVDSEDC